MTEGSKVAWLIRAEMRRDEARVSFVGYVVGGFWWVIYSFFSLLWVLRMVVGDRTKAVRCDGVCRCTSTSTVPTTHHSPLSQTQHDVQYSRI